MRVEAGDMTLLPRTRGRLACQHPGAPSNIQDAITGLDPGKVCHDRGPWPKQRRNEQRLVGGRGLDLSLWNGCGHALAHPRNLASAEIETFAASPRFFAASLHARF